MLIRSLMCSSLCCLGIGGLPSCGQAERWRSRTLFLKSCEILSEFVSRSGRNLRFGLIGAVSRRDTTNTPRGRRASCRAGKVANTETNRRKEENDANAKPSVQRPVSAANDGDTNRYTRTKRNSILKHTRPARPVPIGRKEES